MNKPDISMNESISVTNTFDRLNQILISQSRISYSVFDLITGLWSVIDAILSLIKKEILK